MSYPILYDSQETKFDSNGIGVLADAVSCVVTEERNGPFELQMQYPVDGIHYAEILDRNIIMAKPNPVDQEQPFRVYGSTAPMNGIVTFYARHISYDLLGIPVSTFAAKSVQEAMLKLNSSAAIDCPFHFYTDKDTVADMNVKIPSPIRNLLGGQEGSILDTYGGGDYKFDRFDVWLYKNRGIDRGVNIRYGKNLLDFKQERNCANVYTGVYPYWANLDGDLLELPEKIINGPGEYDYDHIMVLDLSQKFQEKPTEEQLRAAAESYIKDNKIGVPSINLTITHAMLEQTEEYKDTAIFERIDLCDTAHIEFPKLGVSAAADAVKVAYDVLLGRYDSVTFGNARTDITDTVLSQKSEIKRSRENIKSVVEESAREQSALITGNQGGYVVLHDKNNDHKPDEILVMDTEDINTTRNIWRFNSAGIGHSSDGYNGVYTTAWTMDGHMNASLATFGTMLADRVYGGTLLVGGDGGGTILVNGFIQDDNIYIGGNGIEMRCYSTPGAGGSGMHMQIHDFKSYQNNKVLETETDLTSFGGIGLIALYGDSSGSVQTRSNALFLVQPVFSDLNFSVYQGAEFLINVYGISTSYWVQNSRNIFSIDDSGMTIYAKLTNAVAAYTVANTTSYAKRTVSAYNTTSQLYGDIGSGVLDDTGKCYVTIDDVLSESINTSIDYYVFLQKEGPGDLWVSEKKPGYFVVDGTPNLPFSWELKAKVKGTENERIEILSIEDNDIRNSSAPVSGYENDLKVFGETFDGYENDYQLEYRNLFYERGGVLA